MERYEEQKRERRRRDFRRVVDRAVDRMHSRFRNPADLSRRPGGATWEDVFRERSRAGRRRAENPKACSCGLGCGNSRHLYGYRTLRECRQVLAALEQLIESGHRDDEPGRRRLKWRGTWP